MMYTITRGPSKLVTQRRTGPTQQIESKFSDLKLKPTSWLASNFSVRLAVPYITAGACTRDRVAKGFEAGVGPDPTCLAPVVKAAGTLCLLQLTAPKIVFNRLNGKRYHSAATQKADSPPEGFTPAHEENVRFVYEAWQEVEQKLGDRDRGESTDSKGPVQYTEKTPSAAMKNFVPIDLEEWWAQRFLANIANLS